MGKKNILTQALTKIKQDATNDVEAASSAREAFRWTQELDSDSFHKFIVQLSGAAGQIYDWPTPARKAGEDDRSYNVRVEASFMELSGNTLSNLLANCKSWIAIWAGIVLDKGLVLIPEWIESMSYLNVKTPLDHWFQRCDLFRYMSPSTYSRIRSYLLDVHPVLRLYSDKLDDIVKPLLVDEDKGWGMSDKIRQAVDAVHNENKKHRGVSKELAMTLVSSFEEGPKNPEKLRTELLRMGYAPEWSKKYHAPVQVGSWLLGSDETGDKRIEYLVVADNPTAIALLESMFSRDPFVMRQDLGGDSDSRRRSYKDELDQDKGNPVGV